MTDIRDDVTRAFTEQFGSQPSGIWSAPGRVNLIGEHTDYNEGFVLPFGINRRTVVALGLRNDAVVRIGTEFTDGVVEVPIAALSAGSVTGWPAYPLGVVWALGEFGADLAAVPGVDLYIESTVPIGAGLSSSAAIECAIALALNDVWQLGFDRQTLALVGQLAENDMVGAPTGIMDQTASLLGQNDAAVFLDCRTLDAEVIDLGLAEAKLEILIIDTGISHAHATGGYASRRASCEAGAAALGVASLRDVSTADLTRAREILDDETFRRVRHVVTENDRVVETVRLLREFGPSVIGPQLDASHLSMRYDFEISIPQLDLAVDTAQTHGALGARMTGGGFGGSVIALVPADDLSRVQSAVDGAFAEAGEQQPTMFTVRASEGAKRES